MNTYFTAFKEHKDFPPQVPWSVIPTVFEAPSTVALHYADTVELLLFDGAAGEVHIGGRRFALSGRQVFFIAPEVVHAMRYEKSDGRLFNVKLSPEGFSPYLNIPALLRHAGLTLSDISSCPPCYDRLLPFIRTLTERHDLYEGLSAVISLFSVLREFPETLPKSRADAPLENEELCRIINFTQSHIAEPFSLAKVADEVGYSKSYFCSKFREATGVTYQTYRNGVRIAYACRLLSEGYSVSEAAAQIGFSDVPYFIQLFKKVKGVTPKQYIRQK